MSPTIGRLVHYRISEDVVRPAVVVEVHSDTCVNLQVFFDGSNDSPGSSVPDVRGVTPTVAEREAGLGWRTSAVLGTGVGEWSWPPRV